MCFNDISFYSQVGDPYVFELYKAKEDKCRILDRAIARFDGNAIVAATLFMRDTLKRGKCGYLIVNV